MVDGGGKRRRKQKDNGRKRHLIGEIIVIFLAFLLVDGRYLVVGGEWLVVDRFLLDSTKQMNFFSTLFHLNFAFPSR